MSDIALRWNVGSADVAIEENDLALDEGLETAVIVSLFSDRRAQDGDVLPGGHTDRRGWWGDAFPAVSDDRLGSRLWLLSREKQQAPVLERAVEYAREALRWLLDDRVASRIDVEAEFTRPGWLGLLIIIHRPLTPPAIYRYDAVWSAQSGLSAPPVIEPAAAVTVRYWPLLALTTH